MTTALEVLQQCTVTGNNVKLPDVKLDRKLYMDVAKQLEHIGGKWKGNKIQAFVFNEDPTTLLEKIQEGTKVNIKKEYQFFPTPAALADRMAYMLNVHDEDAVLEPSAGQGALIQAIRRAGHKNEVYYCELNDINKTFIDRIESVTFLRKDFLQLQGAKGLTGMFDKIIANPPFSKNQDIDHIMLMWELLAPGGKIVTLASPHWTFTEGKKEKAFRDFLDKHNADIEEIPAQTFKESGTLIETRLLTIIKD